MVCEARKFVKESSDFNEEEKSKIEVCGYGHVGEGNLTLSVTHCGMSEATSKFQEVMDSFVMEYTKQAKGSIAAEHGLGVQRAAYLSYTKTPEMINAMRMIKATFDPNGIMNPYKVLPQKL